MNPPMKRFALIAALAASALFAGAALANDEGDTAMDDARGYRLGWVFPGGVEFEVSWYGSDYFPAGWVAMGNGQTSLTVKDHDSRVIGSAKRVRRGKWIVYGHKSQLGYAIRRGRKDWDAFEGREYGEHRYVGHTSVGPYGPQGVAVMLVFQAMERELEASATRFYAPNGKLLSTYDDPWYDGIIDVSPGSKPGILVAVEGHTPLSHARRVNPRRWNVSRAADQGYGLLGSIRRRGADRWDVWHEGKIIGYIEGPNPIPVGLMELTTRYL